MHRTSFLLGALAMTAVACLGGCLPTQVQVSLAQGVLVAEAGTDGVNHLATIAAPALHGARALQVKACVDATNNATSAATSLYRQGDVGAATGAVRTAFGNIADCTAKTKAAQTGAP